MVSPQALSSIESPPSLRKGSRWLLALGVLFFIFGTAYGFIQQSQVDEQLELLAGWDDSDVVPLDDGTTSTVAELKSTMNQAVYLVFGLNYFLSIVMIGLYFWSKRSPFPAMVTGLCVYLSVIVLNAVFDPATLAQGLLIKALFIGAMISGIKAALAERNAQRA